ncbi:MAG: ArsR/SmtB family transcription factor [Pseudonocardia sp.]
MSGDDATERLVRADQVRGWADLFAALGDPGRLMLLVTIQEAESIAVSDLVSATGRTGTTVSHSLRILRAHGLVSAHREGRTVRYAIAHEGLVELLRGLGVPRGRPPSTYGSPAQGGDVPRAQKGGGSGSEPGESER